jgi:hypothetical protein
MALSSAQLFARRINRLGIFDQQGSWVTTPMNNTLPSLQVRMPILLPHTESCVRRNRVRYTLRGIVAQRRSLTGETDRAGSR